MYSEELIIACLNIVKNQLNRIVYPFVEAVSDIHGQSSQILVHTAKTNLDRADARREQIGDVFHALCSVFPRINFLISRSEGGVAMSDAIIIQAVYIAIGPFFVVEFGAEAGKGSKDKSSNLVLSALGGNSGLRGLRLAALALIRSVSA